MQLNVLYFIKQGKFHFRVLLTIILYTCICIRELEFYEFIQLNVGNIIYTLYIIKFFLNELVSFTFIIKGEYIFLDWLIYTSFRSYLAPEV